MLVSSFITNV